MEAVLHLLDEMDAYRAHQADPLGLLATCLAEIERAPMGVVLHSPDPRAAAEAAQADEDDLYLAVLGELAQQQQQHHNLISEKELDSATAELERLAIRRRRYVVSRIGLARVVCAEPSCRCAG